MQRMKVSLAQIAPVLLNRGATLAKVIAAIHQAADQGSELVAFGETLVPGYPWWVERTDGARFESGVQKDLFARYLDQAVCLPDGDLDHVRETAMSRRIAVVLGIAERDRNRSGTVYCGLVLVDREGQIPIHHRKLMPTYEERLVWGIGDGFGLRTHPVGPFKVGALNCWENWMPLARASLYGQGETLHVCVWPGNVRNTQDIVRFQAREGRNFVVAASGLCRPSDIPEDVPHRELILKDAPQFFGNGGSCVAAPTGEWIVEPWTHEEGVKTVRLDRELLLQERQNFDAAGHYGRPELLRLSVDRRRAGVDFVD
ncbi:MAG: carbon-nitrogen hydrolase family protein [Myxococcota bacterium]